MSISNLAQLVGQVAAQRSEASNEETMAMSTSQGTAITVGSPHDGQLPNPGDPVDCGW